MEDQIMNSNQENSNVSLLDVFEFIDNASVNQRRAIALCLENNKNRVGSKSQNHPKYTIEWWENTFNQRLGGVA